MYLEVEPRGSRDLPRDNILVTRFKQDYRVVNGNSDNSSTSTVDDDRAE